MKLTNEEIFFLFLVQLVSAFGQQSCLNGTACDLPPSLELLAQNVDKLIVSSYCNATYKMSTGFPAPCEVTTVQLSNLIDRVSISIGNETFLDGNYDTYWISEPTKNADGTFKEEFIIVNLTDTFLVTQIIMTFVDPSKRQLDMRPGAMEIQGFDGTQWITWKYLARDCVGTYNKQPFDKLFGATTVCESIVPLPALSNYAKVDMEPINIFGDLYNNIILQKFFMTSAIRFKFKYPSATNDTDLSYYVVSDINVIYRCSCFGHASNCGGPYGGICTCQHNTGGKNCEACLPTYNNVTWQMASATNAFQCQACDCNNRSSSCTYDPVDMRGHCTGCLYGTSGNYCELCARGYYVNPMSNTSPLANQSATCTGFDGMITRTYNCSEVCIPCDCSTIGTQDNGMTCSANGTCVCRSKVMGRKCDTCVDGTYNLNSINFEGCTDCLCNRNGMLSCDKTNGSCVCKNNTAGSSCDACKPTYYNLNSFNPEGCTFCDCDIGASQGQVCEATMGQCACKMFTTGRNCKTTVDTYFGPRLDFYSFEAEYSANVSSSNVVERVGGGIEAATFTGRGFLNVVPPSSVSFSTSVKSSAQYQVVLRYESTLVSPLTVTLTPTVPPSTSMTYLVCQNFTNNILKGTINVADKSGWTKLDGSVCLVSGIWYELKLDISGATVSPGSSIRLDSVVLFPVLDNLASFANSNDSTKMLIRRCLDGEMTPNFPNRTSLGCPAIDYSVMVDLLGGGYACECHQLGSYNQSCSPIGGQCYCKPNVFLRNCSQCTVNSYGFTAGGCIDCGCHPNASVTLKCNDTGICQCKVNVTGDKCDKCIDKQFGLTLGTGCQPCMCSGLYVANDSCLDSGQCFCKPGVAGIKCTNCDAGYYGLTTSGCTFCGCDLYGSSVSTCDQWSGKCLCKTAVSGFFCNTCNPGYFGLGPYGSEGCLKCYCSGKSTNCSSAAGWYKSVSLSKWDLIIGNVFSGLWTGIDQNGTSVPVDLDVYLNSSEVILKSTNVNGSTYPVYFDSPKGCNSTTCFVGYKAASYGQWLNFTLMYNAYPLSNPPSIPPSPPPQIFFPYPEGDVIIRGTNVGYVLASNLPSNPTSTPTKYSIRMDQTSWFKDSVSSGIHPTYEEMNQLLYQIGAIRIRARFSNIVGSTGYLFNATLGFATNNFTADSVLVTNVEQCVCPPTYEGQFCEKCVSGYKLSNGKCEPCQCNYHEYPGTTCDPVTGKCNCTHHTTGDQCENCSPGYYGNANMGMPDSCKACMCPGNVNDPNAVVHSSSRTCNTTGASFVCNCDAGYAGSSCEQCTVGYYGSPSNASINNATCLQCFCNDAPPICDNVNGSCNNCLRNTAGFQCSECKPNFFSIEPVVFSKECQACSCNGSLGCDSRTGMCQCKPGMDAAAGCSSCLPGYYNFTSDGCTACACNTMGTINGNINCSPAGECNCTSSFVGKKCDQCQKTTMWGSTCSDSCSCQTNYTAFNNDSCTRNGQCNCLEGFGGLQCSMCIGDGGAASYPGITPVPLAGHSPDNCQSCGPCYRSLAERASNISINMTAMQDLTVGLITKNFDALMSTNVRTRLDAIEMPLNTTNSSIFELRLLNDTLQNISLLDVPRRLSVHEAELAQFNSNYTYFDTKYQNLSLVDVNFLETGDAKYPFVSMPNTNISLNAITINQSVIYNRGVAAYNSIQSSNTLVQNQQLSIDALRRRVAVVNGTIASSNQSLNAALTQIPTVSPSDFHLKLLRDEQQMISTSNAVTSLNSDIEIAQFYERNTQRLLNDSSDRLAAYEAQYKSLYTQLTDPGGLQNTSNYALRSAQNAATSANQFCDSSKTSNSSVTDSIVKLWTARDQIQNSSLNSNIDTMDKIMTTSIDQYSNQVTPLINAISTATVAPELLATVSRLADNSSATAQVLTSVIQQAINKTQQTKGKLDKLLVDTSTASDLDTRAKTCTVAASSQAAAIRSNIDSVTMKADQTKTAAQLTNDQMINATNTFEPVKRTLTNISNNIRDSVLSLPVTSNTLKTVEDNELKNSNDVALLNSNFSGKLSEYSTWLVTKSQVETCINDLWSILNSLNKPVKMTDISAQTNTHLNQINALTNDINNLEKEINAMLLAINAFNPGDTSCTEATAG